MKSLGWFVALLPLSFALLFGEVNTAVSPKFSAVGEAQAAPCAQERAELEKINKDELPKIKSYLADNNALLREMLDDAILFNTAVELAKEKRLLDYAKKRSAEVQERIEELKKGIAKRKAEQQSFEAQAAQLEERIKKGCPPAEDDWQKAIGKWRTADGALVFELVDLNKADREYRSGEPIKVEGYVRRVPPTWPTKIRVGDLLFISNKVEGDTLFGKWVSGAQKGDCPKLPLDLSTCSLQIDSAGNTLTMKVDSKQYRYPRCEWSDKVKPETFTYERVKE